LDIVALEILTVVLLGAAVGFACYREWAKHKKKDEKQLPVDWDLRLRPLFSDVDRTVWLWLKQVFPEHEVLVKVPVIRFLSGTSDDLKALIQIKDVYCSFTVCSPRGRVIGCIDVPGPKGLKASRRDLKKNLFDSCGLPYAVLGANDLPTYEALRAVFLKEAMPLIPVNSKFEPSHSSQVSEFPASEAAPEAMPDLGAPGTASIDAVSDVRNNLHFKLDNNRKRRLAAMESLKTSAGVIEDNAKLGLTARWDDSFIMGERPLPSVH
jgi:Protein of unknown function (DUF2726)